MAAAQAHADFADLQDVDDIPRPRRVRIRRPEDRLAPEESELCLRLQSQPHPDSETLTQEPRSTA
ncbi:MULTISPECIES: hypothetical protein [unclassified Streptomyces]|uniref:hypothetical protein n=1 Tax=unclassified Streptomyces TaxID=2593676 RepID=UPI002E17B73C|nr:MULTISPECIES: hypothetical protein [unclassified Streptomyces]